MKLFLTTALLTVSLFATLAQSPKHYYVIIKTAQGDCLLQLYNETPNHRDNFVKLVKDRYYDSLLFHRVINNFMIQGGDPESRYAAERVKLGEGGPKERIPAEIQDGLIHKKGTIGAARDNNPEKASSGSQFYLVQGRKFSQAGLDSLETFRMQGKKLSAKQREVYTTIGGTPHLDGGYTVFGELLSGIDVVDRIAAVATDEFDRPLKNERMAMQLLTRRQAANLERDKAGLKPKTGFFTRLFDSFRSSSYKL